MSDKSTKQEQSGITFPHLTSHFPTYSFHIADSPRHVGGYPLPMDKSEFWDREGLHREFLGKAQNAIAYAEEVRVKSKSNRSYERLHDEALAEFYVYNYLHGRSFLATRDETLAALEALAATPAPREMVFDSGHFTGYRINLIRSLLNRFGKRERGTRQEESKTSGETNEL